MSQEQSSINNNIQSPAEDTTLATQNTSSSQTNENNEINESVSTTSSTSRKNKQTHVFPNQAALNNHANQMNPNHHSYYECRGLPVPEHLQPKHHYFPNKAALNNHANQMNPNHHSYYECRGLPVPEHLLHQKAQAQQQDNQANQKTNLKSSPTIQTNLSEAGSSISKTFPDKAALNNHANQMNPDHHSYYECRGLPVPEHLQPHKLTFPTKAAQNNHANQMNPDHHSYYECRGLPVPEHLLHQKNKTSPTTSQQNLDQINNQQTTQQNKPTHIFPDKASLNNHANQMNPDHHSYYECRGLPIPEHLQPHKLVFPNKAAQNNHSNQMNPDHHSYYECRGLPVPEHLLHQKNQQANQTNQPAQQETSQQAEAQLTTSQQNISQENQPTIQQNSNQQADTQQTISQSNISQDNQPTIQQNTNQEVDTQAQETKVEETPAQNTRFIIANNSAQPAPTNLTTDQQEKTTTEQTDVQVPSEKHPNPAELVGIPSSENIQTHPETAYEKASPFVDTFSKPVEADATDSLSNENPALHPNANSSAFPESSANQGSSGQQAQDNAPRQILAPTHIILDPNSNKTAQTDDLKLGGLSDL